MSFYFDLILPKKINVKDSFKLAQKYQVSILDVLLDKEVSLKNKGVSAYLKGKHLSIKCEDKKIRNFLSNLNEIHDIKNSYVRIYTENKKSNNVFNSLKNKYSLNCIIKEQ